MAEPNYLKGPRAGLFDDMPLYSLASGARGKIWEEAEPPNPELTNVWLDPSDFVLKRHDGSAWVAVGAGGGVGGGGDLAAHIAAADPHPQYLLPSEGDVRYLQSIPASYATDDEVSNAISAAINSLIDSAPGTLDTLNELAAALGDDPNAVATLTTAVNARLTQAQADTLYKAIGYVPSWAEITDKPTDLATDGEVSSAISTAISSLIDSAPATLDTLNELAAALNDDPDAIATLTTAVNARLTQDQANVLYKAIEYVPTWTEITDKPATFPSSPHTHPATDIDSGTLDVARLPVADDGESNANELVRSNDSRLAAGGVSAAWVKTGAGVLYAAWADGDPILGDDLHRTNRFVNLTPSNIGSGTTARGGRFRLPVDLEVSSVYVFGVGSSSGVGYTVAIYPVGTGSSKIWDNNGSAFTPTGVGWITMTGATPFSLLKDTDYWMCISNTGAGAAPGVFTPQTYNNISTYLSAGPLANREGAGIPNIKLFTLAGSGVFPATLPAAAAPGAITGTVPIFFLEGTGTS